MSLGMEGAQTRGKLICSPVDHVYKGMVFGPYPHPGDLEGNVVKRKALTNMMRSTNKGITVGLTAQFEMSLDACFQYLTIDEWLEVKPDKMRMAKNLDLQVKRT